MTSARINSHSSCCCSNSGFESTKLCRCSVHHLRAQRHSPSFHALRRSLQSARSFKQQESCASSSSECATSTSRRLLSPILMLLLAFPLLLARAGETQATGQRELPKNYVKFARKLLDAVRSSIEVDLSPADETEVRRKADPAKALVREWVQNWRDSRSVANEVSYKQITESLQLLGEFYLNKGQRARLPPQLGSEILRKLDAASAALPLA